MSLCSCSTAASVSWKMPHLHQQQWCPPHPLIPHLVQQQPPQPQQQQQPAAAAKRPSATTAMTECCHAAGACLYSVPTLGLCVRCSFCHPSRCHLSSNDSVFYSLCSIKCLRLVVCLFFSPVREPFLHSHLCVFFSFSCKIRGDWLIDCFHKLFSFSARIIAASQWTRSTLSSASFASSVAS